MITFVEVAALLVPLYMLVIDVHRKIGTFNTKINSNEEEIEELQAIVQEHEEQLEYYERYE